MALKYSVPPWALRAAASLYLPAVSWVFGSFSWMLAADCSKDFLLPMRIGLVRDMSMGSVSLRSLTSSILSAFRLKGSRIPSRKRTASVGTVECCAGQRDRAAWRNRGISYSSASAPMRTQRKYLS
ncbi:hypothetical protein CISG_08650 [Coccidioides immitis RMSCC 3703]|uniref:Uncharacterized protein n=1 Tax=Coccidioides immitis RMSCC 3703 TaxID=454286 RepID=A0A0J8R744_COCIT|nr:hypothetical protein CISG_08650 [Coccidioides immitis RMSCC 3703]